MTGVAVTGTHLIVQIDDGRILSVPRGWHPRLDHGTPAEYANWELLGEGYGVTWPDLDEFISLEGLLYGRGSMEGPTSFAHWLAARPATDQPPTADRRPITPLVPYQGY